MVQHAAAIDDVETAVEGVKLQDVGLGEFDVRMTEFQHLSFGIGEAGYAEVDRKNFYATDESRHLDGRLAGPTPGHEIFDAASLPERAKRGHGKLAAEIGID